MALRAENLKPKLIILDSKVKITFTFTTQRSGPLDQSSKPEGHQAGMLSERGPSIITSENKNKTKITLKEIYIYIYSEEIENKRE